MEEEVSDLFGTFAEHNPEGRWKERGGSDIGIDEEQHAVVADPVRLINDEHEGVFE